MSGAMVSQNPDVHEFVLKLSWLVLFVGLHYMRCHPIFSPETVTSNSATVTVCLLP